MLISVVIPFYNAAQHLPRCLEALTRQDYPDREFILVDNNSTDGSADIVRAFFQTHPDFPAKLLHEVKKGATAARNRGAAAARGEWLAFTDADCVPDPAWLSDLAAAINADPEIGAFAGGILPAPAENRIAKFLGLYTLPAYTLEKTYRQYTLVEGGFPTANLAVRSEVFKRTGGFDENMQTYGEDHDLCMRIYEKGFGIKCLTKAIVRHTHRSTLGMMLSQAFNFGTTHPLMTGKLRSGVLLVQAPFIDLRRWKGRHKIWIDCNQADKKMLAAVIAGLIWAPLFALAPAYFAYLSLATYRQGARLKIPVTIRETPVLAGLLLLKSAALTAGRLSGSLRHKVICI